MNKKILVILVVIFCVFNLKSLSLVPVNHAYILFDNVNIRKSPEIIDSNVIDKLNIGVKVKIVEKTSNATIINGLNSNWYKIGYNINSIYREGYVWGGLLSLYNVMLNDNTILFGIQQYIKDYGYVGVAKIMSKDSIKSTIIFKLTLDRPVSETNKIPDKLNIQVFDDLGMNPFINIIKISLTPPSDGIISNCSIIGISENNVFQYISEERYWGEGAVGSYSERYYFPKEKNGKKNMIVCIYKEYRFDDLTSTDKLVKSWEKYYKWENNKLVEASIR